MRKNILSRYFALFLSFAFLLTGCATAYVAHSTTIQTGDYIEAKMIGPGYSMLFSHETDTLSVSKMSSIGDVMVIQLVDTDTFAQHTKDLEAIGAVSSSMKVCGQAGFQYEVPKVSGKETQFMVLLSDNTGAIITCPFGPQEAGKTLSKLRLSAEAASEIFKGK